ncbi:MAG: CYTH domain-containing protein [Oscillospiraceae bacterium]
MSHHLEIERKFLIKYPDFETVEFNRKIGITQTYLTRKDSDIERRIRSWNEDGNVKYYYTEKKFLTGFTREEAETEISKIEYDNLKKEKDYSIPTVEKTRYTLDFNNLTFEMDIYPFSNKCAIMEVELKSENQEYTIPKDIDIIKEVTGIKEYGNIPLCKAQKFPIDNDLKST